MKDCAMRLFLAFVSFTALIPLSTLHAQTTVFSDNFNRANLVSGAPTTYTTTITTGDGGALIPSGTFLQLTNDFTANPNASGRVSLSGLTSSYGAGYNPTLGSNAGASQVVEWTTNVKYNGLTNLNGFGGGNFAVAIVLASNRSDFTAADAQGYALAMSNTGTPDPIRLVKFTGGLTANANITDIVNPGVANMSSVNNFASARVQFNAGTGNWSLFVRDDGASAWGDPTTVTNQIGTATNDTTFTNISLANFGFYFGHGGTAANQTVDFDNYSVTVAPVPEPATILVVSGLSFCAIGCVRRCRKRIWQIFTAAVLRSRYQGTIRAMRVPQWPNQPHTKRCCHPRRRRKG